MSVTTASALTRHADGERLVSRVTLADSARPRLPVLAPFTGEQLATIPLGEPADVELAIRRARGSGPRWSSVNVRERSQVLLRFHDLLLERREEALDVIQLESGKARRHAFEEILDTALVARHYGVHAARYLRPRRRAGVFPLLTSTLEIHHPVGVVGVISPWNFPLILGITDVLAALVAGNAVVLRPDEQSSLTALWAAQLLEEAGLPREVLQVVTGRGPVLGPPLIAGVDFLMFTGSTKTGRTVATEAAERLIGFSLELGGKNPMLVLEDADLDAAVDGAVRGSFVGAGQVCVSFERIYVHEALYERFLDRFVQRVRSLRLSASLDYDADMGSLTVPRQITAVEEHLRDALDKGATLLAGGKRRPDIGPLFYEPTVLTGVTPAMRLYAEETFGPVVALYRFADDADAIARANDTRFGLNGSVWSRRTSHALRVARQLQVGTVNINESYAATWTSTASPIGGMKESGFGRRHGAEGILKYTETQTIAIQRGVALAPLPGMSEPTYGRVMPALLRVMRRLPGLR
ncbi:MAG TPA: succinic semialdehyde dehydrogenase [Gemmatimonadaceae bacterium]